MRNAYVGKVKCACGREWCAVSIRDGYAVFRCFACWVAAYSRK
jgi:hypothetical protein